MKALLALLLAAACSWANAQSVTLTGTIGSRAILIVDGGEPKTVAVGDTYKGVKLVSLQGERATIEAAGKKIALAMDTPVSVGASGGGGGGNGNRIVLQAGTGGHFLTPGAINGHPVSFVLDTGATAVALSVADAQRIGLDYSKGQQALMNTANGTAKAYVVHLDSVRVGDVEIHDVIATVTEQPMPFMLLGNTFLNHFSMRRDADQMVLEKRY